MLNLDTNIVIHALRDTLSDDERRLLYTEEWSISAMVLWEMEMLHRAGRAGTALDAPVVEDFLRGIRIWPITPAVCMALRQLDFRSDPADELIAATSIAHAVPLMTRDTRMLESKVVPLAPV